MKLQEEKVYEEDKKIFGIYERRKRNRGRGGDFDSGYNLHLYIECKRGGKSLKNKLYTRYTQEHGQLKLSKKGK